MSHRNCCLQWTNVGVHAVGVLKVALQDRRPRPLACNALGSSTLALLEQRTDIRGTCEDRDHLYARCDHSVIDEKRMVARNFAMVAKMSFLNTTHLTQRINVLKDPLVKIVANAVALPVVKGDAFGNIQMCFIADLDVHR